VDVEVRCAPPWGILAGELFSTYTLASSRSRGHDSRGKYFHKSPTATWIDHERHRRRHYTLIAPDTSSGYTLTNDIAVRHRVTRARSTWTSSIIAPCVSLAFEIYFCIRERRYPAWWTLARNERALRAMIKTPSRTLPNVSAASLAAIGVVSSVHGRTDSRMAVGPLFRGS